MQGVSLFAGISAEGNVGPGAGQIDVGKEDQAFHQPKFPLDTSPKGHSIFEVVLHESVGGG